MCSVALPFSYETGQDRMEPNSENNAVTSGVSRKYYSGDHVDQEVL